jgi:hypothetical protein
MIRNSFFHCRALSAAARLALVLLSKILPESAEAFGEYNPIVACETFRLLCFTTEYYTPSIAGFDNVTNEKVFYGTFINIFEIVQNVDEETDTSETPLTDDQKVGRIVITRDVDNVCTWVQINDEFCASCSTCEETDADGGPLFRPIVPM